MDTLPDQATLYELIAQQRSAVLGFCQNRLPETAVEDMTHDVLLWAFEHSDRFLHINEEGLEVSVKSWLFTKARRMIFDRQRQLRRADSGITRKRIPESLMVNMEDDHALDEITPESLLLRDERLRRLENNGAVEPWAYDAIVAHFGYQVDLDVLYRECGATNVNLNAFRVMLNRRRRRLLKRINKRLEQHESLAA